MSSLATYTRIGVEPDANSIRQQFAAANGWENQYRLIIQLGKLLPALPGEWQQEEFRLKGCESQAWLKGEKGEDGNWHFACDSDARIVRGLIVIVLAALNHQPAAAIHSFVSALESASFFPKISSSHLKSITSSLDFHYDHSRTC
ncbi:SufE family protein [Aeromonas caviae]|uniref:SufE family protein n=1 Tax=Aeromonas caviae TaxID=648 RepID=UPI002B24AB73|nr:SufE family protein [Aeromonas caviae]MEA9431989.1 SufE family protein [Aeromonas caviae]